MWQRFNATMLVWVLLFAVTNIVLLDIIVFSSSARNTTSATVSQDAYTNDSSCSDSCPGTTDAIPAPTLSTPSPGPTDPPAGGPIRPVSAAKEFYIPLGSGRSTSREYAGLVGVEAEIDTANYPRIRSVLLEVSMHLFPGNGVMTVKLFNMTDRHDVWFSELSTDEGDLVKKDAPITLDAGKKLYRVMVQSSLGYEAIVDGARLKIITE